MQRLWEEERRAGSSILRLSTFESLGGAQSIVEEHFESAMDALSHEQKDIAARLFDHLVTPSGTKIAHELSDLADFGRVPLDELRPVLAILADRRILRSLDEGGAVRYEIFHDVLAEPVVAWRASHEAERELERQQEASDRRHRQLLAIIVVGAILLAVMGAVTVYALSQRTEAREQAREAKANEFVASADAELDRDPELSLALAREAARVVPSESSEQALRHALLQSRVRGVVELGAPVFAATVRGHQVVAVTEEGEVMIVTPVDRAVVDTFSTGARARGAAFADDGTSAITGSDGLVRVVTAGGAVSTLAGVRDAVAAAISPDATVVAVVQPGGVRLVEVSTGRTLHRTHTPARSPPRSRRQPTVLTGGVDDTVRVWSGQSGRRVHVLTEHAGNAVGVAFSPDGKFVASASTDGTGRVWRTTDWGLASALTGHTNALTNVSFSADGEHVVTTGKDNTARVSTRRPATSCSCSRDIAAGSSRPRSAEGRAARS